MATALLDLHYIYTGDPTQLSRVYDDHVEVKEKGRNIAEQFEEWDHAMDNIYFDEETGQLMQSVTVPGGDVIQIPYEKEEE